MNAVRLRWLPGIVLFVACIAVAAGPAVADDLIASFRAPPVSAWPWVYCFWLEGNVSREGITADLEAMRRAGIGGLLFMDGDMGNPRGPHRFLSPSWRAMFRHMTSEANRLGLHININNDPGWAGSGGPWVKPEQASQRIVASETIVAGPARFDAALPQPPAAQNFYRDVAVLAFPAPEAAEGGKLRRIANIGSTKSFAGIEDFAAVVPWPRFIPTQPKWPAVPAAQCVASAKVQDITGRMDARGRLVWDVPPGRWLLLRVGHTLAGGTTRSSPPEGTGLECDKLSKAAVETHFAGMVEKLLAEVGPLAGRSIVSTHIDSWESGSGNWTAGFREEFRRRRGYDLQRYLPVLAGLVVDSFDVSERFLWDLRETVSELTLENYAGHMRTLANRRGLRLSIEAYDGTCDDLRYAGRADEPMCEFWQRGCYTGLPLCDLVEEMASAAHVYGRPILGAEALTSWRGDFLDHPATLKPLSDWALCAGVNRFCFSEWIMQPWPNRTPGVSFLFIGTVFHGSLTWWEQSKAWHEYLARCQYMLRRGRYVADVSFLAPEGGPHRFVAPIPTAQRGMIPDRPPYNFDGCPAELALQGMQVRDGRITLPSGMTYRLLVLPGYNAGGRPVLHVEGNYVYTDSPLPKVATMTPQLLRRIQQLVEDGATVLGPRPLASPSLANYPACDAELTALADELWGKGAGVDGAGQRRVGKGRVVWGVAPEKVLADMQTPPDFSCNEPLAGRVRYIHRTDDGCEIYFVANKFDAVVQGTAAFRAASGRPELWRPQDGQIEPIVVFERAGPVTRVPLRLEPHESVFVVFRTGASNRDPLVSLTRDGHSVWATPQPKAKIAVTKAVYGVPGDPAKRRDVTAKVRAIVDGGERRFAAWRLGEGDDPGMQMLKSLRIEYSVDGRPQTLDVLDGQNVCLDDAEDPTPVAQVHVDGDALRLEAWQNGVYEGRTASGRQLRASVEGLPAPQVVAGPWQVRFPMPGETTKNITRDRLASWSDEAEPALKYFSGTAVYRTTFRVDPAWSAAGRGVYLDLGKVAVIARVWLNGRDLGVVWKAPFRVNAAGALRPGDNRLAVEVTNLWVNRLIGDEQLPEDGQRTPEGQLKAWPQWLLDGKPSPTGRQTFASYRVWKKDSPLQESGLLGPVRLRATQSVAAK